MTSAAVTRLHGGRWLADPDRSRATFTVRAHGGARVTGSVPIRHAVVEVDPGGRPLAVVAELDLAAIDTGNPRRDRDLRKPRLLDLDRCPTLTFTSTTIEPAGADWHVSGTVSARGAAAPLDLDVTVSVADGSAAVVATGVLDRRPLGIKAPAVMIGRRLRLRIDTVLDEPRAEPVG